MKIPFFTYFFELGFLSYYPRKNMNKPKVTRFLTKSDNKALEQNFETCMLPRRGTLRGLTENVILKS